MSTKEITVKSDGQERTRVCLTCDLKDNPTLISEYKKHHSPEHHCPIIADGIRKSGIEVMDIYLVDNRMFMICETPEDKNFDECWNKMGTYEKMDEWGEMMSKYQQAVPGHQLEWLKMDRVFTMKE